MDNVSSQYICGVEFFRLPDGASLDVPHYFVCLNVLRPLFDSQEFSAAILRFYFNYITVPDDNGNCLRVVYDTIDPEKVQAIIKSFVVKNKDKIMIFESSWTNRPDAKRPLDTVEGESLRFRAFLDMNTRIFLEASKILRIEPMQKLIHQYRYHDLPRRIPPEETFGEVFAKSPYFQNLKRQSLDKHYWSDLVYFFNQNDFGLHFLVNMSAVEESAYDRHWFQKDWIAR